jgi:hypothetical protein
LPPRALRREPCRALAGLALALAGLACAPAPIAETLCAPTGGTVALPAALVESSGAAVSSAGADLIWTHNDGNSALYAVDRGGRVVAERALRLRLVDWEDLEIAQCPDGGACLYLADTGDNLEARTPGSAGIVRVREPDPLRLTPTVRQPLEAEVFPIRLPDGPRDIEAIFVLPGERPYLVTKGRAHPLTVYRYPPPLRPDTVTLQEVQRLSGSAMPLLSQVTGASASADGALVAIRTYEALELFDVVGDTLARRSDGTVSLSALGEVQGEAVALGPDGLVVLTSEGDPRGGPASMRILQCRVGEG